MKLTLRDIALTFLTARIVVPYVGCVAGGSMVIHDPTGMAAEGLVLGAIALVGGWIVLGEGYWLRYLTGGLGLLSLVLGVVALMGENLFGNPTAWWTSLAALMAGILVLWSIAIARHAGLIATGRISAPGRITAA